jgi:hypothetical protein
MTNNLGGQGLSPHGVRTTSDTLKPFSIRTHDIGDGRGDGPVTVMTVDPNGNYVTPGGGGGSGFIPALETYYQIAASTTAQTIVVRNAACVFYGIENLSISPLYDATITVYDNATTGSGNIIGNYSLGGSQKIERNYGLSCLNGITVVISGGNLNSDGGINLFYSNSSGSSSSTTAAIETYRQIPAGTVSSVINVNSGACLFYGIENLSVLDLTGVTITVYDNASSATGNIIGQFQLGASQSLERYFGVLAANGITIEITGGSLQIDGGVNVLYSAVQGGVPYEKYSLIGGSTPASTVIISSSSVYFYGIENLSVNDLTGVTITAYDSSAAASGNILGQYSPGASQRLERKNALVTQYGIVVKITGIGLNADGGINVLHS